MNEPESIKAQESEYKPHAWHAYTSEELQWWVTLLRKRAEMRTDPAKAAKDRADASAYADMLQARKEAS